MKISRIVQRSSSRTCVTSTLFATVALVLSSSVASAGAHLSGPNDEEVVVIKAGRVITVTGEEMSPGEIVIIDGKIELVGRNLEYPKPATVIDASTQTVMPGLVHPRSRWNLSGGGPNGVNANRKAGDKVRLEDVEFDDLLEAGFTSICFYPPGNGMPGTATVFRTAGDEDERRVTDDTYLRVTATNPSRDKGVIRGAIKRAHAEIEKVEKARKEWDEKQKQAEAAKQAEGEAKPEGGDEKKDGEKPQPKPGDKGGFADEEQKKDEKPAEGEKPKEPAKFEPPKIDPAHQPIVDLIQEKDGATLPLVEVGNDSGVLHADDAFEDKHEFSYRYYLGGFSSFSYVVERLGEEEAFVLLPPRLTNMPNTSVTYNLPAELVYAGCKIAFVPMSDSRQAVLNHRASVAGLVRSGLKRDDAINAMTLHAAEMAGVGDRMGSIEKGKEADLIFLDGDPLNPLTEVQRVMILGETVWEAEEDE